MNTIYDIKIHQKIINFNKFKLIYTNTLDYVKKNYDKQRSRKIDDSGIKK